MSFPLDLDEQARHHRLRCQIAGIPERPYVSPESRHLLLRNRRFHLLTWGADALPPVLFLHGGNQTAYTWDLVCHELAADYRCLALDQRGHGDSEWSYELDYGVRAHAGDIAALVDELGLERFVLVGMSMGCMNGLRYAIDSPGRIAGFVAVDAGPWVSTAGADRIRDFVERCGELDSLEDYVREALRFNPRRNARLLRTSLLHNLRRLPNGRLTWKTDSRRRFARKDWQPILEGLRIGLDRIRNPR